MKETFLVNFPVFIEEVFRLNDYRLVVRLSDQVLSIDPQNVIVLSFLLRSLYGLNLEIEAKKRYKLFAHNHNKSTDKEALKLNDILNLTQ